MNDAPAGPAVLPDDDANRRLLANVRPEGWANPRPSGRYDLVAVGAGEMIGELCLAMRARLGLEVIADTIHPYPTVPEGIRKAAGKYRKTRLTPFLRVILERWFAWRRR